MSPEWKERDASHAGAGAPNHGVSTRRQIKLNRLRLRLEWAIPVLATVIAMTNESQSSSIAWPLAAEYNSGYTSIMKTAVSIPDRVFEQAETVAKRLSMSRSELYTRAIQQFLEAHRHDVVTQKLNEAYADEDSSLDPALMAMQATALEDDRW